MSQSDVFVIGAGPAGLTAAYLLTKQGIATTVIEADPTYVGGISRTASYKDFLFDIGGHRFFSKSKEVVDLWKEILPDDFIERPRLSRIYYNGNYFSYPLKAFEALNNLGYVESALCVLSYLHSQAFPKANPESFHDWVANQFGERLFSIFFKTYTEKVWGMSCDEISADWAAQRIHGLSLTSAVLHALKRPERSNRKNVIKTLIDSFRYPRRGPGMMWQAAAAKTRAAGGEVHLGHRVTAVSRNEATGIWTVTAEKRDGTRVTVDGEHVISSAPLRELFAGLSPAPREVAARAAASLRYRDFVTVALILDEKDRIGDNWIYIHDPGVRVGRVQNFKSWSPEMVPDPTMTCYGLEYFCFEGDGLWNASDEELIALAKKELAIIGLATEDGSFEVCFCAR
jgi:protoporphyrinogen oxidase